MFSFATKFNQLINTSLQNYGFWSSIEKSILRFWWWNKSAISVGVLPSSGFLSIRWRLNLGNIMDIPREGWTKPKLPDALDKLWDLKWNNLYMQTRKSGQYVGKDMEGPIKKFSRITLTLPLCQIVLLLGKANQNFIKANHLLPNISKLYYLYMYVYCR